MKKNYSTYFLTAINILVLILSFISDWYTELIIVQTITLVFAFLLKLGNGIVLRELIALHGTILCLLMPLVGYEWYGKDYGLSRSLFYYMFVPFEDYFSFALPAMSCFIVAICWPVQSKTLNDEGNFIFNYLNRAKLFFERNPNMGLVIVLTGLMGSVIGEFMPASLSFVFVMLYFISYAGIIYIYFTKGLVYRKIVIAVFILFIATKALGGMFTEVAYMGITIYSFIFLGKRVSLFKKLSFFLIGVVFFIMLQSVKSIYREKLWEEHYSGNRAALFIDLFTDKLVDFTSVFERKSFLSVYTRFNQGQNVARVMNYIPSQRDFDGGERLTESVAASLVPRFLWPDKPMAGGQANMKYYTGWAVRGWSTNVGPLGEAYGSFGKSGAIYFMLFLGLFIRGVYVLIFRLSVNAPLIIFWIPVLFYQVTSFMETDTLTLLNSLIKGGVFIYLLYLIFPHWFGKVVRNVTRKEINAAKIGNIKTV